MNIAAVVVTYNRKEMLEKNIEMLFKQTLKIKKIIIIDNNSSDGTKEYITEQFKEKLDDVHYELLDKNTGGAGGFEYGCRIAYLNGYDMVWLMDDDGRPFDENTLSELVQVAGGRDFFTINSLVTNDMIKLSFGLKTANDTVKSIRMHSVNGVFEGKINAFNGTLVSKKVFEQIGYPNGDFFIKGDERDFIDRARAAGAYVATATNSIYIHPDEKLTHKKILGRTILMNIECPWKEYYKMRNYTYMKKRDYGLLKCIIDLLKDTIRVLIADNCSKKEVLFMMYKGFADGLKGKLGATVKP